MSNSYFKFKKFVVHQDRSAMKVTTDACLFGAWIANDLQSKNRARKLLDIGTGTGLLSLMIAQKNSLTIDAVEINHDAVEQAFENILTSSFKEKIKIFQSNILEFKRKGYDIIISNPPFYENELISPDPARNIAHHSSDLKWSELFRLIKDKLDENGTFYLLLPWKRKGDAEAGLMEQTLFVEKTVSVKDRKTLPPSRLMIMGSKLKKESKSSEIIIRNENNTYTEDFIHLLEDYYLYL